MFLYLYISKGTDNFLIARGLIDGFNKSLRKIYTEVENTDNLLMSAIHFHNTHRGDIPHY